MAEWTHLICAACWNADERHVNKAVEGALTESEPCCFCGKETTSGIYIRHDPSDLDCDHDDQEPPIFDKEAG